MIDLILNICFIASLGVDIKVNGNDTSLNIA